MLNKVINKILFPIVFIRDFLVEAFLAKLSEKQKFKLIYKSGYWKPLFGGSLSGAGSSLESTKNIRYELPFFLKNYNIKSILDIPCGDFFWMSKVDLDVIQYIGADIVKELVNKNNNKFNSNQYSFFECDIVNGSLIKVDLIFVRDCLVHLEEAQIISAIKNVASSGSKFFASTTYPEVTLNTPPLNKDRWRQINLTEKPYNLPKPICLLDDSWEKNENDRNKKIGIWLIEDFLNY